MPTTQPIVFDDVANKQGICQDIDFLCGTTLQTFTKPDKVRAVNLGLDEAADFISKVDDQWSFDDSSLSSTPIAYKDTVAGVQTVAIDITYLALRGLYVNDGSENYTELKKMTEAEVMTTKYNNTAVPTGFCLIGNNIFLTPIPKTTTSGNGTTKLGYGLKLLFERDLIYFASDATVATLPYNPRFVRLAVLYACRDYAIAKSKENLKAILIHISKMENSIKESYGRRDKTQKRAMVPNIEDTH